jgi:tetratricopeptide (TPR) repeat protein
LAGGVGSYFAIRHFKANEQWRQARRSLDAYDFEQAQSHLRRYLELRPNSGEAHFLLARACRRARAEDFGGARLHLEEARRLGWSPKEIKRESLMLDFQERSDPDAEAGLRRELGAVPGEDRLLFEARMRGCLRPDRLASVNATLNQWLDCYSDDWYALLWRGAFQQFLDKPHLAVADFERVLQLRPEQSEVRRRLGLMLVRCGYNYEEALRLLESAARDHPDDPDLQTGIAACRLVLKQPEAARTILEQAVTFHPDYAEALQTLALVEKELGNHEAAWKWLQRLEPLIGHSNQAEALKRMRRLEPAVSSAQGPSELAAVLYLSAETLRRLGKTEEADRYAHRYEQVRTDAAALYEALEEREKKPADVDLLFRIGTLYLKVGMGEEGEAYLLRVLRERPADSKTHQALAQYYGGLKGPKYQQLAESHRLLGGGKP